MPYLIIIILAIIVISIIYYIININGYRLTSFVNNINNHYINKA